MSHTVSLDATTHSAGSHSDGEFDIADLLAAADAIGCAPQEHAPPRPAAPAAVSPRENEAAGSNPAATPPPPDNAPSTIRIPCSCGRRFRVKSSRQARRVRCPGCGRPVEVSATSAGDAESPQRSSVFEHLAAEIETSLASTPPAVVPLKRVLGPLKFRALRRQIEADSDRGDSAVVRTALLALAAARDCRALPLILEKLGDEAATIREAAVAALGELEHIHALAPLIRSLGDPVPQVQQAAVASIGRIKDRRAVRALLVYGQIHPASKFLALDAIVNSGETAVPALLELLEDRDNELVIDSIVLLGRIPARKAAGPLIQILEGRPALFHSQAARALGQIRDPRAVPVLLPLLKDSDPDVRSSAATALAQLPDPRAVPSLLAALDDDDANVRLQAIAALGEIRDRRAAGRLCDLLEGPYELRIAAAEALGQIGDERAVDPLLGLLASDDQEILLKTISALRKIKHPRTTQSLLALLDHSTDLVRQRAVDALGDVGNAAVAERLAAILRADRSELVRVAAARALGEIGDPASIDVLLDAIDDEFPVRCRAIVSLGGIGDEAALPALLAMLRDPLPEIRFHAAAALAEIGSFNAVPALGQLLEDPHAMVRRGAAKALAKLGESPQTESGIPGILQRLRRTARGWLGFLRGVAFGIGPFRSAAVPLTIATAVFVLLGLVLYGVSTSGDRGGTVARGNVQSLSFSPDGKQLAVGRTLGRVEFWDPLSGSRQSQSQAPAAASVAFAADSTTLAVASSTGLQLWKDGRRPVADPSQPVAHSGAISTLCVTPDRGTAVSLSFDGVAVVWNLQTGRPIGAVQLPPGRLAGLAIGPDGTTLAAATDKGAVVAWDAQTGVELRRFIGDAAAVGAVAISPDGRLLAAASNQRVLVWEFATGAPLPSLDMKRISQLHFTSDSKALAGFSGRQLTLAQMDSGVLHALSPIPLRTCSALAISPDGSLLAVGSEESGKVWLIDAATGDVARVLD